MSMAKTFRSDFIIRFDEEYAKKMRGYFRSKGGRLPRKPYLCSRKQTNIPIIYDISRRT